MRYLFIFIMIFSFSLMAQVDSLDRIELKNSKIITGQVVKITSNTVEFREALTKLLYEYQKSEIKSLTLSNGTVLSFNTPAEQGNVTGSMQNSNNATQGTNTQTSGTQNQNPSSSTTQSTAAPSTTSQQQPGSGTNVTQGGGSTTTTQPSGSSNTTTNSGTQKTNTDRQSQQTSNQQTSNQQTGNEQQQQHGLSTTALILLGASGMIVLLLLGKAIF
jgi:cobalamin biosynthesis Mg chelatase CobN